MTSETETSSFSIRLDTEPEAGVAWYYHKSALTTRLRHYEEIFQNKYERGMFQVALYIYMEDV